MKPIILEANEMTDSTEVYSSRPHPFFILFIYLILAMVIIAISWMCFSKIDIVVKAQGNVATEDNLSTVTNTLAGNITDINVVDGQQINEGDTLYRIEYTDLDNQLKQQEDSLSEVQNRIEMLKAYLEWLNGNSDALDGLKDNQFYSEYCAKAESIELNYDSVTESTDSKKLQYSTSLNSTQESIAYYEDEITKIELLLTALKDRENPFPQDEVYYYSYVENYIAGYNSSNKQYDKKIEELEDGLTELKSNKKSCDKQIKETDKLITTSNDKIQTATLKISELEQVINMSVQETTVQEAAVQETTAQDNTTQDTTVQDSDSKQPITQENTTVDTTQDNQKLIEEQKQIIKDETSNITTYNSKIKELEETIKEINENIDTAENNISSYEQEKENALYTLQMENIATVEQKKKTSEETLATLKSNKSETQNNLNHVSDDTAKSLTKNGEINNTYSDISTYEAKEDEIQASIKQLESNIGETTLQATKSGVVNLLMDIEKGDYLSAGTEVMTIIPEGSSAYIVELYISNEDIGLIEEGMKVKYEIAAFPSREYGNITGTIQTISKDTKVNDNNGISYYKATATVDNDTFVNSTGEVGNLKIGMACETKVVTGQKSVLRYLLEKINLLD